MDIADLDDEYVLLAQKAVEGISVATVPGVYWVEHFPFLRHIPVFDPRTPMGSKPSLIYQALCR